MGTSSVLDLIYNTNYYDAAYNISLITDLTYQHSTYSYLSVVDRRTGSLQTTADTPPSFTTLQGYLKTIKKRFDDLQSCSKTTNARQDYEYAASLLQHIKNRICSNDTVGLDDQIADFLNIYYQHVSHVYVNTNTAILAYDFTAVCSGSTSTTGTVAPTDLEFIVGTTPNAPIAGTSTWDLAVFGGYDIRIFRSRIKQSQISYNSEPYYTKTKALTIVNLFGDTWQTGELIQIEFIPNNNSSASEDMEFIVGTTSGAPVAGTSVWVLSSFTGKRVRLFRSRIKQAMIQAGSDPYYNKPTASDTMTLIGDTWQTGELLQTELY